MPWMKYIYIYKLLWMDGCAVDGRLPRMDAEDSGEFDL